MYNLKGLKTFGDLKCVLDSMRESDSDLQFLHKKSGKVVPVFTPVGNIKSELATMVYNSGHRLKIENIHKYYTVINTHEYFGSQ